MPNIEPLSRKLGSVNAEERREAAVDLCRLGKIAVPLLLRAMGDVDWRVRKTAVEGLVSVGGAEVIDGLLDALNASDNAGSRNSAIEALVQIGDPSIDALLRIIETPDPDVRKFVIDILGDIRNARVVPALISKLEDDDENVRVASAEALGKLQDQRAVDALLASLTRAEQGWLGYAAAEALGAIGDGRALGPLLAALSRSSLREPILESLGAIGNADTIGPLIASLADPLRIVREVATVAIVAIYRKSTPADRQKIMDAVRAGTPGHAVDLLEDILVTSTGDIQRDIVILLGWIGQDRSIRKILALLKEEELEETVAQSLKFLGRESVSLLLEYLSSENALVRRVVADVLGALGTSIVEDSLIRLLTDDNGHVRSAAAESLGRLRSKKAVVPLLTLLTDEYESVQESAIYALAAIGDETVLDDLMKNFSSQDASLRRNIARLLGKFSSDRAINALSFALKDEEHDVRKAVVQALGNVDGEKVYRSLLLAITDDDPGVRMLAAEALSRFNTSEAWGALYPLLRDADIWVRAAAARGLGSIGGNRTVGVLLSYLESATDIFLLAIVEALGKLKYQNTLGPLLKLVDHPDPEVRKTVLTALSGYGDEAAEHAIISRLTDLHWSVRKTAIELLRQRRTGSIDVLLVKISNEDPDATVRQAAREALRK